MYNVIKSVINSQRFELSDMLRKIDTLWLQAQINDDQKTELEALAREKADPAMSVTVMTRLDDLEKRVKDLENGPKPEPAPADPDEPTATEEYPAFRPKQVYVKGDKITFRGKRYVCVLNEYTDRTTWSPADYPAYWQEQA